MEERCVAVVSEWSYPMVRNVVATVAHPCHGVVADVLETIIVGEVPLLVADLHAGGAFLVVGAGLFPETGEGIGLHLERETTNHLVHSPGHAVAQDRMTENKQNTWTLKKMYVQMVNIGTFFFFLSSSLVTFLRCFSC